MNLCPHCTTGRLESTITNSLACGTKFTRKKCNECGYQVAVFQVVLEEKRVDGSFNQATARVMHLARQGGQVEIGLSHPQYGSGKAPMVPIPNHLGPGLRPPP